MNSNETPISQQSVMMPSNANTSASLNKPMRLSFISPRAPLARGESLSSTTSSELSKGFSRSQPLLTETEISPTSQMPSVTIEKASNDSILTANENYHPHNDDQQNPKHIKDEETNYNNFCNSESVSVPNFFTNNRIIDVSPTQSHDVARNHAFTQNSPRQYPSTKLVSDEQSFWQQNQQQPSGYRHRPQYLQLQRYYFPHQSHYTPHQQQQHQQQQNHYHQQTHPQQFIRSSKKRKFIVIPANSPTGERSMSPSKTFGKSVGMSTPVSSRATATTTNSTNRLFHSLTSPNTKSLCSMQQQPQTQQPFTTNSVSTGSFTHFFGPKSTSSDQPSVNFIVGNNHYGNNVENDQFNSINHQNYDTIHSQVSRGSLPPVSSLHYQNQNFYNMRSSPVHHQQHPVFIVGDDDNCNRNELITDDDTQRNNNHLIKMNAIIEKQQRESLEQQQQLHKQYFINNYRQQQQQQPDTEALNQYHYPHNNDNYNRLADMASQKVVQTPATTTNKPNSDISAINHSVAFATVQNSDSKALNTFGKTNNLIRDVSNNVQHFQQHLSHSNLNSSPAEFCMNNSPTNSIVYRRSVVDSSGGGSCDSADGGSSSYGVIPTGISKARQSIHSSYGHFPILTNSVSQNALGIGPGGAVNFRPKSQNISMRSVVSAHIPDTIADKFNQQMSIQSSPPINGNDPRILLRSSSYIFDENNKNEYKYYQRQFSNQPTKLQQDLQQQQHPSPNTIAFLTPPIGSHFGGKIFSDANSVRSLASIGVGSTDGRKLVIRHVPNSPTELLKIVNPPPQPPPEEDDDDSSIFGYPFDPKRSQLKPRRQHWANKMQFVLACIGYSVGLGNVWRFPYMCYKSGGGAFLVPYFIILIICSTPMLYMELAVGQYTGRGPIAALGQICPLFKGAGLASVVVSFLMSTYYSVIIGYSIYYFFTSMKTDLPWTGCNHRWSTPDCWIPGREDELNLTKSDTSRTPSEEFFEKKVLQISSGIEDPGTMRWELFACLICAWLLVYFATWKSIKSSAKVRYFTATFPFFLIIVLMGRALTLEGAENGLQYFFRPKWSDLGNANIWINAASQNFNSLGVAFGSMISFASYNKYNNNILYDTLAVSIVNAITSILVGIFAFATLGNLALEQGTDIEDVVSDGPGFIFVVYPQVMAKMPYAQLWAVMFFFMLLCLGLNSQFAIVEVVVTSLRDGFPNWIKRKLLYHEVLVLIVCVISFLFGLPNIIQGGMFFFQLIDHYAASISIMFIAFFQMIAIAWCYGAGRLSGNVKQMTGKTPAYYLKTCWVLCGPALLISLWIFSLINYKEPTYNNGKYVYPNWAYGLGWSIASLSLICIPAYAIINVLRAPGKNLCEKILSALKPNIYECRICGEHHCEHDFPEDAYILNQEMTPVIQPKIILRTPPPGHPINKNSPLLTSHNQPNTSVVEDESSCGPLQNDDDIIEKS